jgi:hypothetical protein
LATTDDARVHCAVLKIRAVPVPRRRHGCGRAGPLKAADQRPFPQDPTACSTRRPLGIRLSMSHDRTSLPELILRPNNQCSTSERPPRDGCPGCGSGRHHGL